jgi:hypothetical protein
MRFNRLAPVLAGMLVVGFCSNAFAQGPSGAVTLQWTAPGDDSLTGTAARYDLRFSLFPITEMNFPYCTGPGGLPRPAGPGTTQRFTVYGLLPGLRYYFALKTADERLNWSKLSNVVAFAQPAVGVGPGQAQFALTPPMPNPARTSTTFGYSMAVRGHLHVEIYDVQGRLTARLADLDVGPDTGMLNWDLTDMSGRPAAAGAYLVRAQLGPVSVMRRVVVVR